MNIFYFKNDNYKIKFDLKLEDIGMYFSVSNGKVWRNYTVIMCQSLNNRKFLEDVSN